MRFLCVKGGIQDQKVTSGGILMSHVIRKICLLIKLGSLTSYWAAQLPEDPFKIIQVSPGLSKLQGQFLQGQLQQAESEAVCV